MSMDNSIWVHHWNYFEYDLLAEVDSHGVVTEKELEDPLHYPGAHGFAWMLPGNNDDAVSLFSSFSRVRSNDNVFTAIICNCFSQCPHMKEILVFLILLYRLNKIHQLIISIREGLSKEDFIPGILKPKCKA